MVNRVVLLFMFLLLSACATTNQSIDADSYQFGDVTRKVKTVGERYCSSTSEEFREQLRMIMNSKGIKVDVNYCAMNNFIDAMVN
jgi:hypothetical protein